MNKFTLIRFDYPGLIKLKNKKWLYFSERENEFAFVVDGYFKGLWINDIHNGFASEKGEKLLKPIKLNEKGYVLNSSVVFDDLSEKMGLYKTRIETTPHNERLYYEYGYTRLLLLLPFLEKVTTNLLNETLKHLISLYNLNRTVDSHIIPMPGNGKIWTRTNYVHKGVLKRFENHGTG